MNKVKERAIRVEADRKMGWWWCCPLCDWEARVGRKSKGRVADDA